VARIEETNEGFDIITSTQYLESPSVLTVQNVYYQSFIITRLLNINVHVQVCSWIKWEECCAIMLQWWWLSRAQSLISGWSGWPVRVNFRHKWQWRWGLVEQSVCHWVQQQS